MGMPDLKDYNIAAFGFYRNVLNLEVELKNQMYRRVVFAPCYYLDL